MKRIIMLTMALAMMLVSLGGCFWGYEGHDRDGGYGRDGDTMTEVEDMTAAEGTTRAEKRAETTKDSIRYEG